MTVPFLTWDNTIAEGGGLSGWIFCSYAHSMVFLKHFSSQKPSFGSATYQSASKAGFLTRFSLPTPTLWVFQQDFATMRLNFSTKYSSYDSFFVVRLLYTTDFRGMG